MGVQQRRTTTDLQGATEYSNVVLTVSLGIRPFPLLLDCSGGSGLNGGGDLCGKDRGTSDDPIACVGLPRLFGSNYATRVSAREQADRAGGVGGPGAW
jgi:hypothetical protein